MQFFGNLYRWFWRHPSEILLISFLDGEVPEKVRERIQNHMKHCSRCRVLTAKIEEDWRRFVELASKTSNEPTFSEKELIANTLASIRAWRATNLLVPSAQTPQSFMQTESGRQIADVLGVYLGRRAVDSLLQPGEASKITGEESIEGAESVLRVLIGRRGATAIEAKILRMMNQRPESNSESSIS